MPRPVPERCPTAAVPVWSSGSLGKEVDAPDVMLDPMVLISDAWAHVV